MISELKPELVHSLKHKVHEHNFIRLYFSNYITIDDKGKDIWSKIRSCMDWLTVAIEGIKTPGKHKNMNITSLEFTHFIVTIDMIVEAVKHLWIAIGKPVDAREPYIDDISIFNAREFDKDYTDEDYVKELRAWFGIHAVNGNVVKLEGFNNDVRFFSSWSSISRINQGEFSLHLYSNNSEAEKKYGGTKNVKVDSLIQFAALRYNTLNELMSHIDALYLKEKTRLQNTPIQLDTSKDDLTQLQ